MTRRMLVLVACGLLGAVSVAGVRWYTASLIQEDDWADVKDLPAGIEPYQQARQRILSLHTAKLPSGEDDWLTHHFELGQTFEQYAASYPAPIPESEREILIQPFGSFTDRQREILDDVVEFLGLFYQVRTKLLETQPLPEIPADAQRDRGGRYGRQVLTKFLNQTVLAPRRPASATALIGFLTEDLWPASGLNYVYGEADLGVRTAVWSLARFGDPDGGPEALAQCKRRVLNTAIHETGHVLGIHHCTKFECAMNGSKHLEESDRKPMEFCPHCQAKIWWALAAQPAARCVALQQFAQRRQLSEPLFAREATALASTPPFAPRPAQKRIVPPPEESDASPSP